MRAPSISLLLSKFIATPSALAAIWVVFLLPRALILMLPVAPTSDAEWYVLRAIGMAFDLGYDGNNGAPTAFWPVGWPMALSVLFRIVEPSAIAIGLFNFGSAALGGWLTLLLGRRLFGSETTARIGLLLLAVYPNAIGYVPLALNEVFYSTLLLLFAWMVVIGGRSAIWLVATALVFGFATLVKPQTLVLLPVFFAIDWLRKGDVWQRLPHVVARGALILALGGMVIAPWAIRNREALGSWVAVSTNGGFNLLIGNNDEANGGYGEDTQAYTALMERSDLDEVAADAEAKRQGLEWIATHPGRFLALAPKKLALLWLPDGEAEWAYQAGAASYDKHVGIYTAVRLINQAFYGMVMLGFVASFVLITLQRRAAGQRWVDWWLLPWAVAAYPTAVAVMIFGLSRFHFPVMPFVCMANGWLIATACEGIRLPASMRIMAAARQYVTSAASFTILAFMRLLRSTTTTTGSVPGRRRAA